MKKNNHILSADQFTKENLKDLFYIADKMARGKYKKSLKNKIIATLFYEPSTRTRLSFESAMLKLGGNIISCENAKESSSAFKGENLQDSIKIISNYTDVIVLRHPENNSMEKAVKASEVPIINAGNGTDEHPTQALTDAYTIFKKFGRLNNLKIVLVGDLKNGRTVHSLIKLMNKYNNNFYFVSPRSLKLSQNFLKDLQNKNIRYEQVKLSNVVDKIDILYMTRIQKERFKNLDQYKKLNCNYILSYKLVEKMKKEAIILHPLPRIQELPEKIDNDPRAFYFQQAKNGLLVRMALLYKMFSKI